MFESSTESLEAAAEAAAESAAGAAGGELAGLTFQHFRPTLNAPLASPDRRVKGGGKGGARVAAPPALPGCIRAKDALPQMKRGKVQGGQTVQGGGTHKRETERLPAPAGRETATSGS